MNAHNHSAQALDKNKIASRNTLIIKIALFLNYLKKKDHKSLTLDLTQIEQQTGEMPDVLSVMLSKKYLSRQDCHHLKRACISFTKMQDDTRFGALCIEFNFLTRSNLDLALEEQARLAKNGEAVMLGDLLVDAGMISETQKKLILQKQKLDSSVKAGTPYQEASENDFDNGIDTDGMKLIKDPYFLFYIAQDGLCAYVKKTEEFEATEDAYDLFKESLDRNGIIYGLTDPDRIEEFLKDATDPARLLELASGVAPIPPQDASIQFTFEQNYLKPGDLKEDGSIDFKERGDIPFVGISEVLAVKTPPSNGKDGVNVFGDTVPVNDPMDITIKIGKGVRLSDDGLQAFAEVEGNPKLSADGELSVNDAYFIEGDVDFHTGHVKFDKNIYITGTIKSGFRVEGIDVVANAVDGGAIHAKGDILIKNGITDAQIDAQGTIHATYIHRSTILCMRDLKVIKEIADSEATMDGMCLLKDGRLLSSSIQAKGGAVVKDVGSNKAKPSKISVGVSTYIEKELKRIDATIEAHQNALEKNSQEKNGCETQLNEVLEKLNNLLSSRKRTQSMVEELKQQSKLEDIQLFQKSLIEASEKIEDLGSKKHILSRKLEKMSQQAQIHSEKVKAAIQEKFKIKRLEQNTPCKPILDVGGTIFSRNRIYGKYSHTIIGETQSRIRIMEMSISGEENTKKSWDMVITTL